MVWLATWLRGLVTAHMGSWPHSWHHEQQPLSCPRQSVRGWHQPHREPGVCSHPPGLVRREAGPVGAPLSMCVGAGPAPGVGCRLYQHHRRPLNLGPRVCWQLSPDWTGSCFGLMDGVCVELGIAEAASQSRAVTLPAWTRSHLGADRQHTEELGIVKAAPRSHPVTSLGWTGSCFGAEGQHKGRAGYCGGCVSVMSCDITSLNRQPPWGSWMECWGAGHCGGYSQPCPAGLVVRPPIHWMWVTAEVGPSGRVHGILSPPCVSQWMQVMRWWLKVSAWFVQSHPQGDTRGSWVCGFPMGEAGVPFPGCWEQQTVTPIQGGEEALWHSVHRRGLRA